MQVAASGFTKKHQREFDELRAEMTDSDREGDEEEESDSEEEEEDDEEEEEEEEDEEEEDDEGENEAKKAGDHAEVANDQQGGEPAEANGTASPATITVKLQAIELADGSDSEEGESQGDQEGEEDEELESNTNVGVVPFRDAAKGGEPTRDKLDPNVIKARLAKGMPSTDRAPLGRESRRNHTKGRHRGQKVKQKINASSYGFD